MAAEGLALLMALYSVRSERLFCEQLGYNMLFRWFLDMDMTEAPSTTALLEKSGAVWTHAGSRTNLPAGRGARPRARLMSSEHFTVDGTLTRLGRSLKSFTDKEEAKRRRRTKRQVTAARKRPERRRRLQSRR